MRTFIGLANIRKEDMRDVFRSDKIGIYTLSVYFDNKAKYGIVGELDDSLYVFNKIFSRTSFLKKKIPNKKVDTSKWVNPDKESIRRTMLTNLFVQIITLKNTDINKQAKSAAELLYSILYSKNPSNPQSLTNFALISPEETILHEMKHKEAGNSFSLQDVCRLRTKGDWYDDYFETCHLWKERLKKSLIKRTFRFDKKIYSRMMKSVNKSSPKEIREAKKKFASMLLSDEKRIKLYNNKISKIKTTVWGKDYKDELEE